jgi:hypothetical protein
MSAETGKRAPGNPNWRRGGPSPNPGGQTKEQVAARELLDMRLDAEEYREAFLAGYLAALQDKNPAILKDYADRKLGKPVERLDVAHSGAVENPARPLTTEQLVAIASQAKPS